MRFRAMPVTVLTFFLLSLAFCFQSPAEAGTISTANSIAEWQDLAADGKATVCPAGDGPSTILVTIRDDQGDPLPGALVTVGFTSTCDLKTWGPHQGTTNSSGQVTIVPLVGLDTVPLSGECCNVTSTVTAVYEQEPATTISWAAGPFDLRPWRSFDLDGDGLANGTLTWGDYAVFSSDWATSRCRSNYTADDFVDLADLALVNLHVIHPALKVLPESGVLDFGALEQGVTDSRLLSLKNWGGGDGSISDVVWQLIEDRSWISLTPTSGTIPPPTQYPPPPAQAQQVQVEVNTTGLPAGDYVYKMALNSNSPYEYLAPDSITVTMTVLPPPADVNCSPASLELRPTQGGSDSDSLVVSNLGGSDLHWSITDTCSWTSPVPSGGTTAPGGSTLVVFDTGDLSGYEAGVEYTAVFDLTSDDPDEPSVPVNASLLINQTTGVGDRTVRIEPRNYPNPFGLQTAIRYAVPVDGARVRVTVHDLQGRVVRTLVSMSQGAGEKTVVWDGRDDRGRLLGSGIYLYRVRVGDAETTRKMTLLR